MKKSKLFAPSFKMHLELPITAKEVTNLLRELARVLGKDNHYN